MNIKEWGIVFLFLILVIAAIGANPPNQYIPVTTRNPELSLPVATTITATADEGSVAWIPMSSEQIEMEKLVHRIVEDPGNAEVEVNSEQNMYARFSLVTRPGLGVELRFVRKVEGQPLEWLGVVEVDMNGKPRREDDLSLAEFQQARGILLAKP